MNTHFAVPAFELLQYEVQRKVIWTSNDLLHGIYFIVF